MRAKSVIRGDQDPMAVLQHIAVFCVELRGHDLSKWDTSQGYALAACVRCRAKVLVSYYPLQPQLSGAAVCCQCPASS
jgi:hypothetical protein